MKFEKNVFIKDIEIWIYFNAIICNKDLQQIVIVEIGEIGDK